MNLIMLVPHTLSPFISHDKYSPGNPDNENYCNAKHLGEQERLWLTNYIIALYAQSCKKVEHNIRNTRPYTVHTYVYVR